MAINMTEDTISPRENIRKFGRPSPIIIITTKIRSMAEIVLAIERIRYKRLIFAKSERGMAELLDPAAGTRNITPSPLLKP
jgi:hypothetical protein